MKFYRFDLSNQQCETIVAALTLFQDHMKAGTIPHSITKIFFDGEIAALNMHEIDTLCEYLSSQ